MKRYGIFPIIGTGAGNDPYRASVSDVTSAFSVSLIPSKTDGSPQWHFAMCNVGALGFSEVQQLTNSFLFPDYALDGQLSGMDQGVLSDCKQSLEAYDLDGQGTHLSVDISDLTVSYRSLLISVFQQIDPLTSAANFNFSFDPGEPSGGA